MDGTDRAAAERHALIIGPMVHALDFNWGDAYEVTHDGGGWHARRRDDGGVLDAPEPEELNRLIRADYTARPVHLPAPRAGEVLYRHGVPAGKAGAREPRPGDYPLTCLCECGRTVRRRSADAPWEHQQWRA